MKIRSFTGKTIQEAVNQAKRELGSDAIILHTKRIRQGGLFGLFGRDRFEVTAALDKKDGSGRGRPAFDRRSLRVTPAGPTAVPPTAADLPSSGAAGGETAVRHSEPEFLPLAGELTREPVVKTESGIQQELNSLRKMLEKVLSLNSGKTRTTPLMELLLKNCVAQEVAEKILEQLVEETAIIKDEAEIRRRLAALIAHYFRRVEAIEVKEGACKVVAFIGATGVGKTTTIAKIAANFVVRGHKVALVTADTYRIAAVDQLKTYADIIAVPVDVVYTSADVKAALRKHSDKDLVLIDTPGLSPSNMAKLAELQSILAVEPFMELCLVISSTTHYQDALNVIEQFSIFKPHKLIFTKADEAVRLGNVLSVVFNYPCTLSYLTMGQDVPDDIEVVDPAKLATMILKE
ncbi:MAG: flagellar biosynthesis protein FlhF [Negativicutes bacterium]|nr:flagellar biosynthesis protein FlhF [Negativicutes bacterium]